MNITEYAVEKTTLVLTVLQRQKMEVFGLRSIKQTKSAASIKMER